MGNNDWTDQPIGKIDDDRLDFDEYSQILTEIARTAGTPLTIGIFGPWGSGKTSLMQLTAEALEGKYKAPPAVWFNAWHYDKEEALWRALVVRVLAELRPDVPDS
ncbi:MAG: hypothetical protein GY803_05790, partial [Chloroflexi bacterium]|nr:hypothetical protein [Chloroflexota bacterium]